jgi:hypothetical protein
MYRLACAYLVGAAFAGPPATAARSLPYNYRTGPTRWPCPPAPGRSPHGRVLRRRRRKTRPYTYSPTTATIAKLTNAAGINSFQHSAMS